MAGKSKAARALAKRLAHEQLERLAGGTVSLFLWPPTLPTSPGGEQPNRGSVRFVGYPVSLANSARLYKFQR
jgi:hypothetical protein